MRSLRGLCLGLCFLLSTSGNGSEQVKVYLQQNLFFAEKDGSGYYIDLLREIYRHYNCVFITAAFKRNLLQLEHGDAHIAGPMFRSKDREQKFIFPKTPLIIAQIGLVAKKQNPFDSDLLVKGPIARVRGHQYPWLETYNNIVDVNNVVMGIRMLDADRFRYFAIPITQLNPAFVKTQIPSAKFHKTVMQTQPAFLAFRKSKLGEVLAQEFDEKFSKLVHSEKGARLRDQYNITEFGLPDLHGKPKKK